MKSIVLSADWNLALNHGFNFTDLRNTIDFLRNKGLNVFIIGQSPRFDSSVQEINYYSNIHTNTISESLVSIDLHKINSTLQEIVGDKSFINPSDLFCKNQTCNFKDKNDFYFWDDGQMGRWADGQMGRWADGQMGRWALYHIWK